MIYLLAILWFASGFFGSVYHSVYYTKINVDFPSWEFFAALLCGLVAPIGWVAFCVAFDERHRIELPKITLFKARNK